MQGTRRRQGEAAAVINYWCRVAFTNTTHAFSKKTHGHPLEQYRDCRKPDGQACQQDDKMDDRRELPDEAPLRHENLSKFSWRHFVMFSQSFKKKHQVLALFIANFVHPDATCWPRNF